MGRPVALRPKDPADGRWRGEMEGPLGAGRTMRDLVGRFRTDAELWLTDFSQIELRILAHLSGDPELLKLFQEPERDDVFSALTSQW